MTARTIQATFENLKPTCLLILCPRGFANERTVYAIPAQFAEQAEIVAGRCNPEGYVSLTHTIPFDDALPCDRRAAGAKLIDFTRNQYLEYLDDMLNDY